MIVKNFPVRPCSTEEDAGGKQGCIIVLLVFLPAQQNLHSRHNSGVMLMGTPEKAKSLPRFVLLRCLCGFYFWINDFSCGLKFIFSVFLNILNEFFLLTFTF